MKRFITLSLTALICLPLCAQKHNEHEFVDLGLAVKWATCNIGASSESESGDYFSWGETSPKKTYSMKDYTFWESGEKVEDYQMSKYVPIASKENYDKKTRLDIYDDAAHVIWGGNWRMPNSAEWKQLIEECDWKWTETNGVCGYEVSSRVNDNSIFLPAAGYKYCDRTGDKGRFGYYWSSVMSPMNLDLGADILFYEWEYKNHFMCRSAGLPIRPVFK